MKDKHRVDSSSKGSPERKDIGEHQALEGAVDEGSLSKVESGVSRRTLAKAGASVPILMSFLGRPAWGAACSISGLMSGDASGHHDDCEARGCSSQFWKDNVLAWEGTGVSPGEQVVRQGRLVGEWTTKGATTFYSVFGYHPNVTSGFRQANAVSLMDVLLEESRNGNIRSFDCQVIAAFLNASKAYVYGATPQQVVEFVQAAKSGQPFQGMDVTQQQCYDILVQLNESGECFLNSSGQAAAGYVLVDGRTMPACSEGARFDVVTQSCVRYEDWNAKSSKSVDG